VFVDADGRVVGVFERLRPWRTARSRDARNVVELAPGTCSRAGIAPGVRIEMRWHSST
jgi:uncharacterized membrane protein (UPF0127 family)